MEHGTTRTSEEGERLLEVLVHGSLKNESTRKDYSSKWGTWTTKRARANLGPWLHEADGVRVRGKRADDIHGVEVFITQEREPDGER